MKSVMVIFFSIVFFLSCSHYILPVGVEPHAKPMERPNYEIVKESWGESSSYDLMWLFTVTKPADYQRAVDNALAADGGDNLIDVVYYKETKNFILGRINIYRAEGKVIRYKQ